MQKRQALEPLVRAVKSEIYEMMKDAAPPLLLKIAPDLNADDLAEIAETAMETQIDGLIATNTTTSRPECMKSERKGETGGLSGRPLFSISTRVLSELYRLTDGTIPLVGVGGISNGKDAYEKIRAGASLVQLYSAMVYEGPGIARRIVAELSELLAADGFSHLAEAVGADHRND